MDSSAGEKKKETESVEEKREETDDSVEEKREETESDAGEKTQKREETDESDKEKKCEESKSNAEEKGEETDESDAVEKQEETDESEEEESEEAQSDVDEKREERRPDWYQSLMHERFDRFCRIHKNCPRNIFCFRCCAVECRDCMAASHPSHPQIRVLTNLVSDGLIILEDMSNIMDCSHIQVLQFRPSTSGKKLIRMKPTHQVKSIEECEKSVHVPYIFCSLTCKVDHLLEQEEDLSGISKLEEFGEAPNNSEDYKTVTQPCKVENELEQEADSSNTGKLSESGTDSNATDSALGYKESNRVSFRKRPRKRPPTRSPLFRDVPRDL